MVTKAKTVNTRGKDFIRISDKDEIQNCITDVSNSSVDF